MKTGLIRKQRVTEFYFNKHNDPTEIYTHNTDLKKRLPIFAGKYPKLCQPTEDDEQVGLRLEIDKYRIDIHCTLLPGAERSSKAEGKRKWHFNEKAAAMRQRLCNADNRTRTCTLLAVEPKENATLRKELSIK